MVVSTTDEIYRVCHDFLTRRCVTCHSKERIRFAQLHSFTSFTMPRGHTPMAWPEMYLTTMARLAGFSTVGHLIEQLLTSTKR